MKDVLHLKNHSTGKVNPRRKVRVILYLFPSSCVGCIFCATVLQAYSIISIKHPVLLNVLVWIFHKKSLLNDIIYLKFWQPQYIKSRSFLKKSLLTISISNFRSLKWPGLLIKSIEYLLLHPFQYIPSYHISMTKQLCYKYYLGWTSHSLAKKC